MYPVFLMVAMIENKFNGFFLTITLTIWQHNSCTEYCCALLVDHIVGVIGVAHSVGTPQKHLERNVGDELPHLFQSLPWTLVEEAHSNIKGGTYRQ